MYITKGAAPFFSPTIVPSNPPEQKEKKNSTSKEQKKLREEGEGKIKV
jgi:hypothetical protein